MKAFGQDISRLEEKLRKLVSKLELLTSENSELKLRINELSAQIEGQKNQIKELDETNKIVKLADGIQNRIVDNEDVKNKINEYIREIDRCIAILSE